MTTLIKFAYCILSYLLMMFIASLMTAFAIHQFFVFLFIFAFTIVLAIGYEWIDKILVKDNI